MICCRPSRRELVRLGAILAGASLVPVLDPERVYGATGTVAPVNLELVTLTETSAVLTWYTGVPGTDDGLGRMRPAPADSEVVYGTHPARLNRRAGGTSGTPHHHVELAGLEPGRTYYYQARSQGKAATATFLAGGHAAGAPTGRAGVFAFTTPQPPRGRFLFSIALCNDLHLGETVAGLIGQLPWIKGISQVPGHPPYPEIMARALVADARRRGATYLLAAGDVSSEAAPHDVGRARQLLDRFGTYRTDYFVARGNHDRGHAGDAYGECRPGKWQGRDCFRDGFFGGAEPTYFVRDLHGLRLVGLDTYDKPGDGGDAGGLSAEQLAWLRAGLRAHRHQPTLVFGHHPLITPDAPQAITGGTGLEVRQSLSILREYARGLPPPRRPHAPQQALRAARRHPGAPAGGRRGQGVSRRLHAAARAQRRVRAELLQDA